MFGLVPWSAGTVKNVLEGLGRREKKTVEGGTKICNMTLTTPSLHLSLNPRVCIKTSMTGRPQHFVSRRSQGS